MDVELVRHHDLQRSITSRSDIKLGTAQAVHSAVYEIATSFFYCERIIARSNVLYRYHRYVPDDASFNYFEKTNALRAFCIRIVTNRAFDWVVFVIVLASSVFLALDSPSVQVRAIALINSSLL